MTSATYVVEADWGDDGSFTGSDVVTDDVITRTPLLIDRGVDTYGGTVPLGGTMATALTFQLRNDDYTYHPEYASSPLFGDLDPGKDTQVRTTAPSAVTLARGFIDEYEVDANPNSHTVTVHALGGLSKLVNNPVTVSLKTSVTTGDAIGHILDAVDWPAGRRNLDTGATTIPFWYLDDIDAMRALRELVQSEGPGAIVFEDGDGDIVFHDRHHRFTAAASKTSQVTFRGTGTEPVYTVPHRYDAGHDRIVNEVTITPIQLEVQPPTLVWTSQLTRIVPASGGTLDVVMDFDDPVVLFTGAGIFGDNLGSTVPTFDTLVGTRIVMTLTNSDAADATVTDIQFNGQTATETTSPESVTASDATSQSVYGVRAPRLGRMWCDLNTAQSLADVLVNDYKDPQPVVTVELVNANSTRLTQILTREVNDRITINQAGSGMSRDFYIDRVTHTVGPGNVYHQARFQCVAVGTPLVAAGDVFIFDDATQGKFDTGKFGY